MPYNPIPTSTPKTVIVSLGPKDAEELLSKNKHNRKIRTGNLEKIERDLAAGRWDFNGESIKISADNIIIDGQHRLIALSRVEDPNFRIRTILVTGLPFDSRRTVDTGARRNVAETLSMDGHIATGEANSIVAALRFYLYWERYGTSDLNKSSVFSDVEIYDWVSENKEKAEVVQAGLKIKTKAFGAPRRIILACLLKFHEIDPDDATYFFEALSDGFDLTETSPIYHLREKMLTERRRTYDKAWLWMIIRCWNAYRKGEPIRLLKQPSARAMENFPEPI